MNVESTYSETPPMKPPEADIGIKIDFAKGGSNPSRVFSGLVDILDGFQALDHILVSALDPEFEPVMVLEDVEAASITAWVRTRLRQVDDEVLKSGDWKKGVGAALVAAKHRALRYLDAKEQKDEPAQLQRLGSDLQELMAVPARHLPRPLPIDLHAVVRPLDRIQAAKSLLLPGDRLLLISALEEQEANLSETKRPSEFLEAPVASSSQGTMPMQLLVRKPDYLGDTKWEFRHGPDTINATIKDHVWLQLFRSGLVVVTPGSALACLVRYEHSYDAGGRLLSARHEIVSVERVVTPTHGPTERLI